MYCRWHWVLLIQAFLCLKQEVSFGSFCTNFEKKRLRLDGLFVLLSSLENACAFDNQLNNIQNFSWINQSSFGQKCTEYISIYKYKVFLVFRVLECTGTIGCFMLSALLSPTLNQLIYTLCHCHTCSWSLTTCIRASKAPNTSESPEQSYRQTDRLLYLTNHKY